MGYLDFLNLPNEILLEIVEKSDIRSILILRKVCHHLRNLIDDSKLSVRETNISISIHYKILTFSISSGRDHLKISYQDHKNGCLLINKPLKPPPPLPLKNLPPVPPKLPILTRRLPNFPNPPSLEISKNDKAKLLEGTDFVEEFVKNLNGILKILGWRVNSFSLSLKYTHPAVDHLLSPVVNRFLEFFFKKCPLHMNYASIWCLTPNELLKILPWIEPRKLHPWNVRPFPKTKIEAKEFVKLGYWKQMETFNSGSFLLTGVNLRDFLHFKSATVAVESVSCEDVKVLKDTFLYSTTFEHFKIKYENFAEISKMSELLGIPCTSGEWLLHIPESGKSLRISLNPPHHHCVHFSKC